MLCRDLILNLNPSKENYATLRRLNARFKLYPIKRPQRQQLFYSLPPRDYQPLSS